MRRDRTLRVALAVAVAAPVAVLLGFVGLRPSSSSDPPPFVGSLPPPGIVAPDFTLPDQAGRLVRMRDLRGQVVLVTFLDTRCVDACPVIGGHIRAGLALLSPEERRSLTALAISVNPDSDTPAAARGYLRSHRLGETVRYLLGSEAELRPVWDAYAVIASLDTGASNVHSAPVRIFDEDGIWVSTLRPESDLTPQSLANDLRVALSR